MKRECPHCGEKLKSKDLSKHVAEVHKFICYDDCVRCCANKTVPISLTIGDLVRISRHLGTSISELFGGYCDIDGTELPIFSNIFPVIGLKTPCRFLKDGKCSIYDYRPLYCRLFPEDLIVNPLHDKELEMYKGVGYKCIDIGFKLDERHRKMIEGLSATMEEEMDTTCEYFRFDKYPAQFLDEDRERLESLYEEAKDAKEREEIKIRRTEMAREKVKEKVGTDFSEKIKELDREGDLAKYDRLEHMSAS